MALNYLLPKEDSEKLKNELELLGKYKKFPDELERTLFLSDVTFKWDSNTTSYISKGSIGIASVGKNQVNRYVTGIIEFKKKRGNDEFAIYLELAKDQWYFFTYRNNHLMALASDINFNDIVREAVTSRTETKRIQNLVKDYTYSVQTERVRRDFLRKFETEESE
jgi:hypothetical protein